MSIQEYVTQARLQAADTFAKQQARYQSRGEFIEHVQRVSGLTLVRGAWDITCGGELRIDKKDLPKIRKAVGRLTVAFKRVPSDYDTTKEIIVVLEPMKQEYKDIGFTFAYRQKYYGGKKCRVVKRVQSYTTTSLECDGDGDN